MFTRGILVFLVLFGCLFLANDKAITSPKAAIEVDHTGDDFVGQRLAYQLKEEIRRSSSLRLTNSNEPRLIISIITIDLEKEYKGNWSAYSIAWLVCNIKSERFITHNVGYCGASRVKEIAESIVAKADKKIF